MRHRQILLVEDSENDIELTIASLGKYVANRVDVARDGAEALDYLFRRGAFAGRTTGAPVLVMLDLKMPKVDGLEVLRTIKADPVLRQVPVVVLTSSREQSDVVQSYQLGVNAYVVKPVEFDTFADAVKQLGLLWLLLNEPPPLA
jgi:two-component system response regulator